MARQQIVTKQHYGYSKNPEYDVLMYELGMLACEWRTTKLDKTVKSYHDVLHKLMEKNWRGELPVDIELPDRLMPDEYLAQFK